MGEPVDGRGQRLGRLDENGPRLFASASPQIRSAKRHADIGLRGKLSDHGSRESDFVPLLGVWRLPSLGEHPRLEVESLPTLEVGRS